MRYFSIFLVNVFQTLPFVLAAFLATKYSAAAVFVVVLALASVTLIAFVNRTGLPRTGAKNASPYPKLLVALFSAISACAWVAHVELLGAFGSLITIIAALVGGLIALAGASQFLRAPQNQTPSRVRLSAAAVCMISAVALMIDPELIRLSRTLASFSWGDGMRVVVLIAGIGALNILRPMLCHPQEALSRGNQPLETTVTVLIETFSACLCLVALNLWRDGGSEMVLVAQTLISPAHWSAAELAIIWVGIANTAIGLVWLAQATNVAGVATALTFNQVRPAVAYAMQVFAGLTVFTWSGVVKVTIASILLLASLHLVKVIPATTDARHTNDRHGL
mgnify:CR=1 FL=1